MKLTIPKPNGRLPSRATSVKVGFNPSFSTKSLSSFQRVLNGIFYLQIKIEIEYYPEKVNIHNKLYESINYIIKNFNYIFLSINMLQLTLPT